MNPVYGVYRVSLLAIGLRSQQGSICAYRMAYYPRICLDKERENNFFSMNEHYGN